MCTYVVHIKSVKIQLTPRTDFLPPWGEYHLHCIVSLNCVLSNLQLYSDLISKTILWDKYYWYFHFPMRQLKFQKYGQVSIISKWQRQDLNSENMSLIFPLHQHVRLFQLKALKFLDSLHISRAVHWNPSFKFDYST